jgi:hypothetical protein
VGLYVDFLGWSEDYSISDAFEVLEDDDIQTDLDVLMEDYRWVVAIFFGVCCLVSLMAIWGAAQYNACTVAFSAVWHFLIALLVTVFVGLGGIMILVSAVFAYPHLVFYQEHTEGIMTEDNYGNEVHSCCCVPHHKKVSIRDAIEKRLGVFA